MQKVPSSNSSHIEPVKDTLADRTANKTLNTAEPVTDKRVGKPENRVGRPDNRVEKPENRVGRPDNRELNSSSRVGRPDNR
jgi:hypothetical protein